MTNPRQNPDLKAAAKLLRHRLFRSWVLLFGILPIDLLDGGQEIVEILENDVKMNRRTHIEV